MNRNATKNTTAGFISRRGFLKGAAAAGVIAGFPAIIPASARGADGTVAPSNRIVMGAIGVGGMGVRDVQAFLSKKEVQMVAICDVDKDHRERSVKLANDEYQNNDCAQYVDFRELIGRGDLDAITLATPDHWHAIPIIAAARAGLDIHAQKPLARSIREGRAVCDAVLQHGRIWQTGSQQRSDRNFHHACELVCNGRIGKIQRVEVGLPSGSTHPVTPIESPPDKLDWDLWLGPAPWQPYRSFGDRGIHGNWRWLRDYSGGQLTDWAGHHIDIAHWSLGLEHTGPSIVEGWGVFPTQGLYNVPYEYYVRCTYANGVVLEISDETRYENGVKWYGENGWIFVSRVRYDASDPNLLKEEIGPGEIRLYRSRDHKQNFLDCVKTRQETVAPVEVAQRSISVALLGEISILTGRTLRWNPEKEEIIGDPGANAMLEYAYREPWVL